MDNDTSVSQPIDENEELEPTSEVVEQELETVEEVDDSVTTEEPEEAEGEEAPVEETPQPSRRENLRIQQLIQKMKQAPQQQEQPKAQGIDYRTALDADDEVYSRLESDRETFGAQQYQQGIKQAESIQFHTRLEIDAPKIASKYKQFDTESPEFNPAVANAVNEWYLATAGFDPNTNQVQNANVRYADFVEGIMEMADEIAGQKVQKATKNIAKQAAKTGVRPDGSRAKRMNLDQAPQNMTDEELAAAISRFMPSN